MIRLSLRFFQRVWKTYCFVIIQMMLVFCACAYAVFSIHSCVAYYLPLKALLSQKGVAVRFTSTYQESRFTMPVRLDYRYNGPYGEDFTDFHETGYARYRPYLSFSDSDRSVRIYSYCQNVFSVYHPDLDAGNWEQLFTTESTDDNILPVVVYQADSDYQIGEIMEEAVGITYDNEEKTVRLKIAGIMNRDSFLWGSGTAEGLHSHLSLFQPLLRESETDKDSLIIILSQEAVDRQNIVAFMDDSYGILRLPDETSDKQLISTVSFLQSKYQTVAVNLSVIHENSKAYIGMRLLTILPGFLGLLLLTVISSMCINTTVFKRNMKEYAMIQLCGGTRQHCTVLCMIQLTAASLIAGICAGFIVLMSRMILHVQMKSDLLLTGIICSLIAILNIGIGTLFPYMTLKTNDVCSVLRANSE